MFILILNCSINCLKNVYFWKNQFHTNTCFTINYIITNNPWRSRYTVIITDDILKGKISQTKVTTTGILTVPTLLNSHLIFCTNAFIFCYCCFSLLIIYLLLLPLSRYVVLGFDRVGLDRGLEMSDSHNYTMHTFYGLSWTEQCAQINK